MTNGRSSGFIADVAVLMQLVQGLSDVEIVGKVATGSGLEDVTVAGARERLSDYAKGRVAVEEQDHTAYITAYIIHLSNEPILWIFIPGTSPLFAGMRQLHDEWRAQHPGSQGWIAF